MKPESDSITIQIDALNPDINALMRARTMRPKGISIGPGKSQIRSGSIPHEHTITVVVVISLASTVAWEIAKDAAKEAAKEWAKKWLIEFVTNLKAKRIRVQGHEPKDEEDLRRIVAEEIEIGKND